MSLRTIEFVRLIHVDQLPSTKGIYLVDEHEIQDHAGKKVMVYHVCTDYANVAVYWTGPMNESTAVHYSYVIGPAPDATATGVFCGVKIYHEKPEHCIVTISNERI